jgi:iron(III) transport system substrate-binding protein
MWKDMAYGTTFEPAAFVYNKRLVTRRQSRRPTPISPLISQPKFQDKVTTYDIEKSGVGFMFMTQDSQDFPQFKSSSRPSARPRCACSPRPAPCSSGSRRART